MSRLGGLSMVWSAGKNTTRSRLHEYTTNKEVKMQKCYCDLRVHISQLQCSKLRCRCHCCGHYRQLCCDSRRQKGLGHGEELSKQPQLQLQANLASKMFKKLKLSKFFIQTQMLLMQELLFLPLLLCVLPALSCSSMLFF